MKAIRVHAFGDPSVMRLDDVPDPTPGAGQIVVRVHAAGVNPVDTYIRSGTYALKPNLPYTPGGDGAGVIESIGVGVVDLKVGQRVWISLAAAGRAQGTYAERAVCDARHVHPLPDRLSFAQGAAINTPYVTAYRALFDRAALKPGEVVLIHGASGGVGIAAVQLAAAYGAIVFGTAGTDEGLALARDNGAAHAFNHKQADYLDQIVTATGPKKGVDVVIEMLANVNLDKDLGLLAPGGRVVIIGNRGRVEIDPRQMMVKESTVTGVTYWGAGGAAVQHAIAHVSAGFKDGALTPIVGAELPLADAAKAHERVMQSGAKGKIVLTM